MSDTLSQDDVEARRLFCLDRCANGTTDAGLSAASCIQLCDSHELLRARLDAAEQERDELRRVLNPQRSKG